MNSNLYPWESLAYLVGLRVLPPPENQIFSEFLGSRFFLPISGYEVHCLAHLFLVRLSSVYQVHALQVHSERGLWWIFVEFSVILGYCCCLRAIFETEIQIYFRSASANVRCTFVLLERFSVPSMYLGQVLKVTLWGSSQCTQLIEKVACLRVMNSSHLHI